MADKFDLVIIGSGNGGYIPAIRASQLGMSVALVEKEQKLGGTCLNWGCIPTKALLHTAELLNAFHHSEEFGISSSGSELDYEKVAEYRDRVVGRLQKGVQGLMKKNKVQVFTGAGSFVEPKKIKVEGEDGEQELEGENVLIATGSAVRTLPGLEIDHEKVVSSDDVVTAKDYPDSVIILGSGAVGVEFASMYADYGTEVTIVEVLDKLVPGEDPEISEELRKRFEERGIRVMTGSMADTGSLEKTDDGVKITVSPVSEEEQEEEEEEADKESTYGGEADAAGDTGEDGDGETLEAEQLLVAIGRKTMIEDLNLDATSVELNDSNEIQVDEFYRTAEDGVYAAGDVIGGYWLAHAAGHEGIIAVEHMAGEDPMPLDQNLIPRVTFCRPEIASFGLTREQAEEEGYEVKESKFPFLAIGKALIEGEPNGFVKVVADTETDLILGMHMIGPKVTDLVAEGVFAKLVEGTPQEIGMAVHAHPSLAEVMGEAAMAVDGHAIHI
ncbi:MAG: dihydrolipoyl dehydrogenase [Actinobacteria bacterium]|nr:dihydrolipoyl dehydrogenase [Actinomycetota bacterium]MCA1739134.1 dihydrolipoyl dehydrogenase [Actinomycetota bacterium]